MQRILVVTDVSVQSIGPIFKLRHKGCPETSVTNYQPTKSEDLVYTSAES